MTKKLLFLFDTDPVASVFDTVVGYDGGADNVIGYGGVTAENVGALVDGCIYTRGPKEKQNTAIFVGGASMISGEAVLKAVKKRFFSDFRVSVMLDFKRLKHDGCGGRGPACEGGQPQRQKGCRARRHRPGWHARCCHAAHRRCGSHHHRAR